MLVDWTERLCQLKVAAAVSKYPPRPFSGSTSVFKTRRRFALLLFSLLAGSFSPLSFTAFVFLARLDVLVFVVGILTASAKGRSTQSFFQSIMGPNTFVNSLSLSEWLFGEICADPGLDRCTYTRSVIKLKVRIAYGLLGAFLSQQGHFLGVGNGPSIFCLPICSLTAYCQ